MSDVLGMLKTAAHLHQQGQLDGARDLYKRVLASAPRHGHALHGLGLVFAAQGNLKQAHALLKDAAKAMPGAADILANLARVCLERERPRDAAAAFRNALKVEPDQPDLLNGLGAALEMLGDLETAQENFLRAHALRPDVAAYQNNATRVFVLRGERAEDAGRWGDSLAIAEAGLVVAPEERALHIIKAHALLVTGRIREGQDALPDPNASLTRLDLPAWDGGDLGTGRLVVRGEQGIGDQLIFASALADLAARVERLTIECDRRFVGMLSRSFPDIEFVGWSDPPQGRLRDPEFTVQAAMHDVLGRLRPDLDSFPPPRPYLLADPKDIAIKRRAYRAGGPEKAIGIAWASRNTPAADRKSIPLDQLARAIALPGVRLLSLQYGDHRADIARVAADSGIDLFQDPDLDPLQDLDSFAAAVAACDAVVSSSNSAIHFAGALGVPTWGVLPAVPYWHWFSDRDDSPWYTGVRLIRRKANETSWQPALKRARHLVSVGLERQ